MLRSSWRSSLSLVVGFIALFLMQLSHAEWDRERAYRDRVAELEQEIQRQPNAAALLIELADFYLNPVVRRRVAAADGRLRLCPAPLRDETVAGGIKDIWAVPWVFRGDPDQARPLLNRALALSPGDPGAVRLSAMYYRMKGDVVRMQPYVEEALRNNPTDLDMARLYLDFHTVQARMLNDQAAALRKVQRRIEDRSNNRRVEILTYPSDADLARAAALDTQAQDHRRKAVEPLRNLVVTLKGNRDRKATHDLANAIYYHWIGQLDTAGGAAKAALEADPTDLAALDYLIELTRGTHSPELYRQYKAIRDSWAGADTTIRKVSAPPLPPKS